MKKRFTITTALTLIGAGAALIYADLHLGLPHETAITLASVYGALGFASLGILERDWRSALILALCGVMVGAFGPTYIVVLVAIPAIFFMLAALLQGRVKQPKEKEPAKPDLELPDGGGILLKTSDAVYFQLFRGQEQIYLIALGSVYYHFNPSRVIRTEDEYQRADGDLVFKPNEMRAINVYPDGSLRILPDKSLRKRARQDERFVVKSPMTVDDVCQYLKEYPVNVKRVSAYQPSEETARSMRNILFVLSFASVLCAAIWMHTGELNKLLIGLNVILPMLAFGLFCAFGYAVSKKEKNNSWDITSSGWYFSTLPLMIHSRRNFNFDSFEQSILPFLLPAGCAFLLCFAFNARNRPKEIGNFIRLVMSVITFCAFAVGPLNFILDNGSRVFVRPGIVVSQTPSDDPAPFDTHYLFVDAEDGYHFLKVSREIYDAVEVDDAVTVQTHTGPLGIDYTDILVPSEGEGQ